MNKCAADSDASDSLAWYHIVLTTYGAWLYGDPRGFRTPHHREHVEGDYKRPPPAGTYRKIEQRSRESLKQAPVQLDASWRTIVGGELVEKLVKLGALLLCCSVSSQHAHVLAKLPRRQERHYAARAKRHARFVARDHGWRLKLWARCSRAERIVTRQHQLNVYRYILRHAEHGAWIWQRQR